MIKIYVKTSSNESRVGPKSSVTGVLIRKEETQKQTHKDERMSCEDTHRENSMYEWRDRAWSTAFTNQGMPKIASNTRS